MSTPESVSQSLIHCDISGATIGIAVAIGFTWIPMSGELANFLGGVVGAGLGAVVAIGGAVYVQRRDRRDALVGPATSMIWSLEGLRAAILAAKVMLENPPKNYIEAVGQDEMILREVTQANEHFSRFPMPFELGREVCSQLEGMRIGTSIDLHNALAALTYTHTGSKDDRDKSAAESLGRVVLRLDKLLSRLRAMFTD